MRMSNILVGSLLSALVGCQAMPHPAPGLSAVQVKVIAEPKAGVISPRVSVYDTSSGSGYGDFERVDYSDLHDIVVWIERRPIFVDIPLAPPPAPGPATIDLTGRAAPAGLTAVASAGQKLIFHNTAGTPLSAYCVADGNEFNLGMIPAGGQAEATMKAPDCSRFYRIRCPIRSPASTSRRHPGSRSPIPVRPSTSTTFSLTITRSIPGIRGFPVRRPR